jgi:AraC-like DNA-binding protein
MERGFRHYTPRWPLTDYVEGFWSHGHYAQPHGRERVMPTGTMNLVFRCDGSGGASVLLSGAHSTHFLLDTSRPFSAIAASFKPGGGFPFFGLPADELENLILPLETVLGVEAHDLRDRLLEAPTTLARFQALERFLLARLDEHTGRSAAVLYALRAFHGAGRVPPVASVSAQIGWTATRFIATFRNEVGLAPKAYCRVARFRNVLASLASREDIDWTDVALSSGYFDQAHFIHDFKEFSGVTPSAYLRERVSAHHVRVR